jgi:hypothetical protein
MEEVRDDGRTQEKVNIHIEVTWEVDEQGGQRVKHEVEQDFFGCKFGKS